MAVATFGRPELPIELRATRAQLVAAARARLAGEPIPAAAPVRDLPGPVRQGHASDAVIEQRYAYLIAHVDEPVKDQAAALGVTYGAVVAARQRLAGRGLITIPRHETHREWTEEEDRWLQKNVGRLSFEECGRHLGRSATSCEVRAKKGPVHIDRRVRKQNRDTMNASDVAAVLGQDIHFVERQLIKWGLLKATKHEWLATNGTMQWAIRREDLVDFLLDYPWQYDRERITDQFFRRVADEAWNRDPLYTSEQAARIIGLDNSHGVTSFIRTTAPKFIPRSKLVVRRRGNPRATWSRSFAGMQTFIPRSTLLAIRASGWVNYRTVSSDTEHPTVETAVRLLWEREDRPGYVTRVMLRERVRRFYKCGAVPTRELRLGARKPWLIARSMADVLELLPAIYARSNLSARITPHHRGLIRRHEPELLKDQRALLLAQATGELTNRLLDYMDQERRAEREFRLGGRTRAVYVAPHVARTLDILGNRTRYVGRRRGGAYHLQRCVRNLVAIPLKEARRHALRLCAHCDAVAKERGRRSQPPVLVACSRCGDAFPRPVGRPAKEPRCTRCRDRAHDRRAA